MASNFVFTQNITGVNAAVISTTEPIRVMGYVYLILMGIALGLVCVMFIRIHDEYKKSHPDEEGEWDDEE